MKGKNVLSFPFTVTVSLLLVEMARIETETLKKNLTSQGLTTVGKFKKSGNELFFTADNVRNIRNTLKKIHNSFIAFNQRIYGVRNQKCDEIQIIREKIRTIAPKLRDINAMMKADVRINYENHDCDYTEQISSCCMISSYLRLCNAMVLHYSENGEPTESQLRALMKLNVLELRNLVESLHDNIGTPKDVDVNDSLSLPFFKQKLTDSVNKLYIDNFTYRPRKTNEDFGIYSRDVHDLQSRHDVFHPEFQI